MKTININLKKRGYPIYVGEGLIENYNLIKKHISNKKVVIITNDKVAPLYLQKITNTLSNEKDIIPIILPDGEAFKNIDTLNIIYDALLTNKANRQVTLIALGGGVIGDITGFAAATFMRGVDFIQIPTTLLSQVDSSVGGKTGINHPLGKNMIGAFYQPKCVIADISLLQSLPDKELSAGLAEVIKYGLIRDSSFFEWLEQNIEGIMKRDSQLLIQSVVRSCQNKADIVEADEFESGIRAILNLGHTFGHAIETATGYGKWLHGEAIAIGMVMAAYLSEQMGWLSREENQRIKSLIIHANLPINPPEISMKKFLDLMQLDKKTKEDQINLVLQQGIGKAILTSDYDTENFHNTLLKKNF
ncbi:3-dehydroquinate synthase [Methylophilaceae bacterium]|jgi:3-dehydroquinate synthase|nr:3-dehydroquinate synthase [Methylophilaceae bacterium]